MGDFLRFFIRLPALSRKVCFVIRNNIGLGLMAKLRGCIVPVQEITDWQLEQVSQGFQTS